jgi:hypothetical protein
MKVIVTIGNDTNKDKFEKLVNFLNENEISVTCFLDSPGGSIGKLPSDFPISKKIEYNEFTHKSEYHK